MREVLQVGQCSREFQARTRASAVVLLRCMHVKAGPFCAIASYANMESLEKRVQRQVDIAEAKGDLELMNENAFKEIVRIQLSLTRICNQQYCEYTRPFTLRNAVDLILKSVSGKEGQLRTTDPLVRQFLEEIELSDTELDLRIGKFITQIALNWRANDDDCVCVESVVYVLRQLASPLGQIRRFFADR